MMRRSEVKVMGTPGAGWAYAWMVAAVAVGVFSVGAPWQVTHGAMAVLAGLAMVLFPPRVGVPRLWCGLGAAVVVLGALAFLPKEWGFNPPWRQQLEALGVGTGGQITAHAAVSFQLWVRLALTVVVGLWLLGHRLHERGQVRVLVAVAWMVGAYAALCLGLEGLNPRWKWDPVGTFGLFPNRNHTATLLVIGSLAGLVAVAYLIRRRHGGWAGLALLPTLFCVAVLLGYSVSRGGLALLAGGLVAWVAGLVAAGTLRLSGRVLALIAAVTVAVGALFWYSDAEIKSRLLRPAAPAAPAVAAPPPAGAVAPGAPAKVDPVAETAQAVAAAAARSAMELNLGVSTDTRWSIYRDTLPLLGDSWLTGIGHGMFEHIIPRYRRASTNDSLCLHPESDWLWLAAEAGVPCALALLVLVGSVAGRAVRAARRHHGWTLRWGGLVTALVVPMHGLIDVPGHRQGLAVLALVLAAAALRPEATATQRVVSGHRVREFFRLAGVTVLAAGIWLLWAEWGRGRPTPVAAATQAFEGAWDLYQQDQVMQQVTLQAAAASAAGGTAAPVAPPGKTEVDLLRQALDLCEQGLRITPLDATMNYQRGILAVHFKELESVVDQSFATERLLDPMPASVALSQARGWLGVDPDRAVPLWQDALHRAEATAEVTALAHLGVEGIYFKILDQAQGSDELMRRALQVAGHNLSLIRLWAARGPSAALFDAAMPGLIEAASSPEELKALMRLWQKGGNRQAIEAFKANQAVPKPTE